MPRRFNLEVTDPLASENPFAMGRSRPDAQRLHPPQPTTSPFRPKMRAGFGYECLERPTVSRLEPTLRPALRRPAHVMDLGLNLTPPLVDKKVDKTSSPSIPPTASSRSSPIPASLRPHYFPALFCRPHCPPRRPRQIRPNSRRPGRPSPTHLRPELPTVNSEVDANRSYTRPP